MAPLDDTLTGSAATVTPHKRTVNVADEQPEQLDDLLEGREAPPEKQIRLSERDRLSAHPVSWGVAGWFIVIHLGALASLAFISWQAVLLTVFFHWLTGGAGVCLGFHRLLTHRSFETTRWVRFCLAAIAGWAGEGSVLFWVANHRKHHAYSDKPGDPHTPNDGAWWSHMMWTIPFTSKEEREALYRRWIPDLRDDWELRLLDSTFLLWHIGLAIVMGAVGYAIGGGYMATSFVLWGMFMRLALVLHSTWFVNSASHMWGYRNYDTTDDSRNNWWVALITYGEGWHNNHHAYPRMARHGHRWWEIDMTFMAIRVLQFFGLAWNIVDHQHERRTHESIVRDPQQQPIGRK
ncbi:MAG: fatty acid desaturase [Planctomycetales bacterium]|nr:fatty acid desaturase [Planctomycetales bacterium]